MSREPSASATCSESRWSRRSWRAGSPRSRLSGRSLKATSTSIAVDEYQVVEPGPRSNGTFAEFMASAGPRASLLPAVYAALGLPEPDPSSPIRTDEEERLQRFLKGWDSAESDETLLRAARLIAEGTRMATQGWGDLFDEQVAGPARERLYRGEIERFPDEVREVFSTLLHLQPRMTEWLIQRYNEQRHSELLASFARRVVDGIAVHISSDSIACGRDPRPKSRTRRRSIYDAGQTSPSPQPVTRVISRGA